MVRQQFSLLTVSQLLTSHLQSNPLVRPPLSRRPQPARDHLPPHRLRPHPPHPPLPPLQPGPLPRYDLSLLQQIFRPRARPHPLRAMAGRFPRASHIRAQSAHLRRTCV